MTVTKLIINAPMRGDNKITVDFAGVDDSCRRMGEMPTEGHLFDVFRIGRYWVVCTAVTHVPVEVVLSGAALRRYFKQRYPQAEVVCQ